MQGLKRTGIPKLIEPEDVQRRVARALKTLWALPDKERAMLAKQTQWPFATIDDRGDLNSQAENAAYLAELDAERLNRFRPTPADIADLHTALRWFNALGLDEKLRVQLIRKGRMPLSPEQWLIWWRVKGLSFASIARRTNTNDETARRRTASAWHIVWSYWNMAEFARLRRARDGAAPARSAQQQDEGGGGEPREGNGKPDNAAAVQPARDETGLRGAGPESSGGDRPERVRGAARGRQR